MLSDRTRLATLAAIAMIASAAPTGYAATSPHGGRMPPPPPRRPKGTPLLAHQSPEVAEWNARVEAKRRARKGGKGCR